MRRTLASLAVIGVFSLMLVGTAKPKDDPKPIPTTTATSTPTVATPSVTIPNPAYWTETPLKSLKIAVRVPKGARVPLERVNADAVTGGSFTVLMPSGYGVYVKVPQKTTSVADTKKFYRTSALGTITTLYDADDAVVANRKEPDPVGMYCEVTACSAGVATASKKAMCTESAGADVNGKTVTKMTADECLDVVAILRSLRYAP